MALLRGTRACQHFRLARSDAHLFARGPFETVYQLSGTLCVTLRRLLEPDASGSGTISQLVVGLA